MRKVDHCIRPKFGDDRGEKVMIGHIPKKLVVGHY